MIRIRKQARATITTSRIALPILLPNPPRPHASPLALFGLFEAFVQNKEGAPAGRFLRPRPQKYRPNNYATRPARCHQVCYFGRSYGPLEPTRRRGSDVLVALARGNL